MTVRSVATRGSVEAEVEPEAIHLNEAMEVSKPTVATNNASNDTSGGAVGSTVADVERNLILNTLDHCLGNRTHAAKILGISIRTLRNKLNQYEGEGVKIPASQG